MLQKLDLLVITVNLFDEKEACLWSISCELVAYCV